MAPTDASRESGEGAGSVLDVKRSRPDVARVVEAAARKGVAIDVSLLGEAAASADDAAAAIGVDPGQIVGSIVFVAPRPEGRLAPVVCLVSARNRVDDGMLAAVMGEPSLRRASAAEVLELTGFGIVGLPPFGFSRNVRVVMDQDLGAYEWVWAWAGSPAAMLRVSPGVLRMLANALVTPLAETGWMSAAGSAAMQPRLSFEAANRS
jgi:prolyl-tRNA editing enzyme YbaK/EbsC (Cys-tRNA(Pro) deacylase)